MQECTQYLATSCPSPVVPIRAPSPSASPLACRAGERFQVVRDTTQQLLAQICSQGDCWEAFPDRASLCISQGWFLPDGRLAWNVEHGRWAPTSTSKHATLLVFRSFSFISAVFLYDTRVLSDTHMRWCCWTLCRETTSVSLFAESLVHRRVPQLVAAALGGVSTSVSPTGQQSARCSNPILMESVMMDTFPMPVTLPVTEGERSGCQKEVQK